jgi:uncharacterized protein (TIRG00374 family)
VKSSWWKTGLKYGIGLALLAYVVWSNWSGKNGQPGLRDALNRPIQWIPFAIAAVLCATNTFLTFVRWFLLVRAQNLPFTLTAAVRLGLVGYYFNTFLPGAVGGDLLKAAFIAREQQRRTVAVATVLIDRAIGLWALVLLVAAAGSAFWLLGDSAIRDQPYLRLMVRIALWLVTLSLLSWVVLGLLPDRRARAFNWRLRHIPKVGHSAAEFWTALWLYRTKGRVILTALLMSLVGHTCSVMMFYCVVSALQPGDMPSIPEHFLIVPVGMAAQGFFPAPGGVGGGEFVFGWLYTVVGRPESAGVLGSLGQRILAWTLGLIGYILYMFMKKDLPVSHAKATA